MPNFSSSCITDTNARVKGRESKNPRCRERWRNSIPIIRATLQSHWCSNLTWRRTVIDLTSILPSCHQISTTWARGLTLTKPDGPLTMLEGKVNNMEKFSPSTPTQMIRQTRNAACSRRDVSLKWPRRSTHKCRIWSDLKHSKTSMNSPISNPTLKSTIHPRSSPTRMPWSWLSRLVCHLIAHPICTSNCANTCVSLQRIRPRRQPTSRLVKASVLKLNTSTSLLSTPRRWLERPASTAPATWLRASARRTWRLANNSERATTNLTTKARARHRSDPIIVWAGSRGRVSRLCWPKNSPTGVWLCGTFLIYHTT